MKECLQAAGEYVQALHKELEEAPAATSRRKQAARMAAAEARRQRVTEALVQMAEAEAKKKPGEMHKARVSTTDPDARVMKMSDGGFRPAYNGQFALDTQSQVVVGVAVSNSGSDQGKMPPMVEQVRKRYGAPPDEYLVDGGFAKHEDIETVTGTGCTVYAPVPKSRTEGRDPHETRSGDSEVIAVWRARMATEEAKEIYKERASTAECVNALARNRGLQQFGVRGTGKVLAILLWYALAHNLMRALQLLAAGSAKG